MKNCGSSPNFEVCAADLKIVNPEILTSNNRIKGDQDGDTVNDYTFDSSGNTTLDAGGQTYVYDAENKMISASDVSGTLGEYFYDGDGRRVKKIVPSTGEVTVFVYDAAGKSIAEYSTVVESAENAKVAYLTADHLGSPRINTDATGQVISRHDYHPFGEEIARTGHGSDTIRKQFTGYERDNEINLDFAEARYYNPMHGRFTSVDPLRASGKSSDPQTFNRYVYVRNSPLVMTDPTGMIGDYFSYNGTYLGNDGKDDQKVYFARLMEDRGAEVDLYKDSIRETTLDEVLKAQDRAVALTPGTDNPIQDLVQRTGQNLSDSITGIEIGASRVVDTLTNPLGPAGAMAGVPNPFEIAAQPENARQAAYALITETGITAIATAGAGSAITGPASAGLSLSVVPEAQQMSRGAQMITDLVGRPGQATGTLNNAGDLVITGRQFKFRVDFRNPGNDVPHMHLQELVKGDWVDAVKGVHRIRPK